MKKHLAFGLVVTFAAQSAYAGLCTQWSQPREIGQFDSQSLEEVSGIVFSRAYPDRLYSHNDSGSGASFFVTSANGSKLQEVQISGLGAFDVEDISYGPCGGQSCIYLADIGDNFGIRTNISVSAIPEQETFGRSVQAAQTLELKYPDGSHNAEAMAVHPNGDIYIVTKEKGGSGARSARLYRAPRNWIANARGPVAMQFLGSIDVPRVLNDTSKRAIVTGMDISADGTKFLLITYTHAIEFNVNLATVTSWSGSLVAGKDYSIAKLSILQQQEAIAYKPDTTGFLYTTELGDGSSQPIEEVTCLAQ